MLSVAPLWLCENTTHPWSPEEVLFSAYFLFPKNIRNVKFYLFCSCWKTHIWDFVLSQSLIEGGGEENGKGFCVLKNTWFRTPFFRQVLQNPQRIIIILNRNHNPSLSGLYFLGITDIMSHISSKSKSTYVNKARLNDFSETPQTTGINLHWSDCHPGIYAYIEPSLMEPLGIVVIQTINKTKKLWCSFFFMVWPPIHLVLN